MAAKDIATPLLDWYDREHRQLPWRIPPGSEDRPDPYRVWLSEIMLQQTTVAAVIPYFEAFTARWPSVEALAGADEADVMAAWAGLGYYARARNLIDCARTVANEFGGRFPDTETALRQLPGIGPYTAAAIAAIGYGQAAVVVDGNVERVVARLFAVEDSLPDAKPLLRRLAGTVTPHHRPGDFAQAMMDLGARVCRPKAPRCDECPLSRNCKARALGTADAIPRRPAKAQRPVRYATAFVLRSASEVLVERRPRRGLLGGMLALPMGEFASAPESPGTFAGAPLSANWRRVAGEVRHVFTHFELRMSVALAEVDECGRPEGIWLDDGGIALTGLPTVFRKAVDATLRAGA